MNDKTNVHANQAVKLGKRLIQLNPLIPFSNRLLINDKFTL